MKFKSFEEIIKYIRKEILFKGSENRGADTLKLVFFEDKLYLHINAIYNEFEFEIDLPTQKIKIFKENKGEIDAKDIIAAGKIIEILEENKEIIINFCKI